MEPKSEPGSREALPRRNDYVAPTLTYVGLVTEIVQSGTGKSSTNYPDGPDIRKPPGQ
jgi:hypothetical protein